MNCRIIFLLMGIGAGVIARAQSDYDLSQRWLNESIYNPGALGNSHLSNVFLHARAQWVGVDGAPVTQVATFDTYVKELRSAFGILLLHDQIGYINTYNVKLSYAYHIPVGESSSLALGLAGGWLNRNRNIDPNMADDIFDPLLAGHRPSDHRAEFDFGVEYNGPVKIGASLRHLGFYSPSDFSAPPLTLWTYASIRLHVAASCEMEPCLSYNYRTGIHYIEAGALFHFSKIFNYSFSKDSYWVGAMYRMHRQFALLFGVHVSPHIRIGYSFDYGLGHLASASNIGTHEVVLAWRFGRIFYKDDCCSAFKN
jgi:type IX secretion system PorP/SprF family membrane protein